jgi:hypothetical protein
VDTLQVVIPIDWKIRRGSDAGRALRRPLHVRRFASNDAFCRHRERGQARFSTGLPGAGRFPPERVRLSTESVAGRATRGLMA